MGQLVGHEGALSVCVRCQSTGWIFRAVFCRAHTRKARDWAMLLSLHEPGRIYYFTPAQSNFNGCILNIFRVMGFHQQTPAEITLSAGVC